MTDTNQAIEDLGGALGAVAELVSCLTQMVIQLAKEAGRADLLTRFTEQMDLILMTMPPEVRAQLEE